MNESRPGKVNSCSSVSGCEGTKAAGGPFNDDTHSSGGKLHGPARLNVSQVSIASIEWGRQGEQARNGGDEALEAGGGSEREGL